MKMTLTEIKMLRDAIHEWEQGVYGQEDEYDKSSGFKKNELKAMQNVKEKLLDLENKLES